MKNIFKNKRNILIMMFALVVIMGIGFAAYSQQLKINETSSIDSNWDVYIKSVDVKSKNGGSTGHGTVDSKTAASLTTDLKYPGDNVIYNITVANDGTIDALLEKINFNMEKENTVIKYYYSVDDEATWNEVTKDSENPYDVDLLANTTDEFQVKVEYDPTKTGTATEEQKSNKLTLNLDYVQKTGGGTVVPSNSVLVGGQMVALTDSGDGLYADEYEAGRYVYKGSNPNNNITFNDEDWIILSIENDGTLKIVRKNVLDNHIAWDSTNSINWAKPSTLNTYLNGTYYNSLSENAKGLIVSHDFGIGSITKNNTNLSSQITSENNTIWNGKIGLMKVSDLILANSNKELCGNFYLNNNDTISCNITNFLTSTEYITKIWTLSPYREYGQNYVFIIDLSEGYIHEGYAPSMTSDDIHILPATHLKSDITLSGSGSVGDPFTINS